MRFIKKKWLLPSVALFFMVFGGFIAGSSLLVLGFSLLRALMRGMLRNADLRQAKVHKPALTFLHRPPNGPEGRFRPLLAALKPGKKRSLADA
jgi:hypothetical protein